VQLASNGYWHIITSICSIIPVNQQLILIFYSVKIFLKQHFTLADIGNEKLLLVAILHH